VTSAGATSPDGRRLRFLHNWSWLPASVNAPVTCRDVLGGNQIAAGDDVRLSAWDVRVLTEE
jgi:beta-galactosidase